MSTQAMSWAWEQGEVCGSQNTHIVLLALAEHADPDGECWPSRDRIAGMCGYKSKGSVTRHVNEIVGKGLMRVEERQRPNGSQQSNRYFLALERVGGGGAGATGGVADQPPLEPSIEPSEEPTTDGATAPSEDLPQRLWDDYQRIVKKSERPSQITPSMRRVAEKALAEFDYPDLSKALVGFMAWRSRKQGDMRFSTIFASHPGGRPLHDHIEFWIDNAGGVSGLTTLPSDQRANVMTRVRDVQRGHGSDDPEVVQRATEAVEWLRQRGIETVRADDGRPTFPSLTD